MLVWCLKHVKDLILEFSICGRLFSEKTELLDYYGKILASRPLGGCIDEVVNRWENYQGYIYDVYFLRSHKFAVTHFVNGD